MSYLQVLKCKTCGEPLDVRTAKNGVIECRYCATVYTLPKEGADAETLAYLRMGEHDLDTCNWENAAEAFRKAGERDKNEPEAYWGKALASYKVQYIKDVVNNRLQPVCHEISDRRFTESKDYRKALELATFAQRTEYEKKAAEIDYIKEEFYKLKSSGLDYDCFLCVKVTDENGGKTDDYRDADYIYDLLKNKGYEPFFSERSIRNRTGADYEAMILYALYSSESMLVVCRNEEYLQTPWVKNEYTRFLRLVNDEEKESDSITFVYYERPIEKLSGKRGKIQGIDFSRRDADEKIVNFVETHTPVAKEKREEEKRRKQEEAEAQAKRLKELQEGQEKQRREWEEQQRLLEEQQEKQRRALEEQQERQRRELEEQKREIEEQKRLLAEQLKKLENVPAAAPVSGISAGLSDEDLLERIEAVRRKKEEEARKKAEAIRRITKVVRRIAEEKRRAEEARKKAEEEARKKAEEEARKKAEEEARKKAEEEACRKEFEATWQIENDVLKKYKGKGVNVVIPDIVKVIGRSSFKGRASLTSVTIPNGITEIGNQAFGDCKSLTSITIPDSVNKFGEKVFENCPSLKNIIASDWIKEKWETEKRRAEEARKKAEEEARKKEEEERRRAEEAREKAEEEARRKEFEATWQIENGVLKKYKGKGGDVVIPEEVTEIGEYAFYDCDSLTSVTIPNGITEIGCYAFYDCDSLASVTIPNSVTTIKEGAFRYCKSLKNVYISDLAAWCKIDFEDDGAPFSCGLGYGGKLYLNGKLITDLIIPDNVTMIKGYAFRSCQSLKSVTIPDGVKKIGEDAFCGCQSLKSVTISNSVTKIERNAFYYCELLKAVYISDLTAWCKIDFGDCAANPLFNRGNLYLNRKLITDLIIPNNVAIIKGYAFHGCDSLTNVTIPDGVTEIEDDAFGGCFSLRSMTIPNSVTKIGKDAFSWTPLISVTIPNSVTKIGIRAFERCESLLKVTMPKRLKDKRKDIFDKRILGLFSKCKFTYT